jgi:hypothetical protein
MTQYIDYTMTPQTIDNFLAAQKPKPGRRVIWNSYAQGTYIKSVHGPIGSGKHKTTV